MGTSRRAALRCANNWLACLIALCFAQPRYPGLLQFIVERKLDGQIEQWKERTLGVEVFGRGLRHQPGSHRSRLGRGDSQYYHEPGYETELRIELPLGSYVPVFHLAAAAPVLTPAAGPARTLAKKWWWLALAACLSVATLSRLWTAAIDQFWQLPGPIE